MPEPVFIILNGERVPLDEYLDSLSVDEVRAKLAATQGRINEITQQLEHDALNNRRGDDWRHKARIALRTARFQASYLARHLSKIEKEQRFADHFAQVPDAHLIALERTRAVVEAMIERDRLQRERDIGRSDFFVKAASKLLSREQFVAIWEAAVQIDPTADCWTPMPSMTSAEHDAMRRAKKLRAMTSLEAPSDENTLKNNLIRNGKN